MGAYENLIDDLYPFKLDSARQAKTKFQIQAQEYAESNSQYRAEIQSLMRVLDNKQQQLNVSKRSSQAMEEQVKALKREASAARKQLDALQKKQQALLDEKQMIEQHIQIVKEAMASGRERELACLEHDLRTLKSQFNTVIERFRVLAELSEAEAYQLIDQQASALRKLQGSRKGQDQQSPKEFLDQIQSELAELTAAAQNSSSDQDLQKAVTDCRDEVAALVNRIQKYSTAAESQWISYYASSYPLTTHLRFYSRYLVHSTIWIFNWFVRVYFTVVFASLDIGTASSHITIYYPWFLNLVS